MRSRRKRKRERGWKEERESDGVFVRE